ncbi:Gfo/Idh/MocA family oxidoreductase [Pseudomonas peli]|uniref:Gfo/Idh/MocA family oxidoreductase n=1 Tax=Pseudomonas peli TaxID=592361 RepID=UPI003D32356E
MKNVLLIGAGNLGRRHLQSLKNSQKPIRIFVVEPFDEARALAETAFQQAASELPEKVASFHRSLDEIDQTIDIVIDATPATGRLIILKRVLALGAKDLVLEKVTFNSVSDIDQAGALVEQHAARAWVNCPRRLNPFYIQLRSVLATASFSRFEVVGENFGMACNAIHFIDLFSFLAGRHVYDISLAGVQDIVPSKRSNYIEFFGVASGAFESGPEFKIDCRESTSGVKFKIRIVTPINEYLIDEVAGRVEVTDRDGNTEALGFRQRYQGELTGPLVDAIIQHQQCGLTVFSESMALHRPFIEAAYALYASKYKENAMKMVPIT